MQPLQNNPQKLCFSWCCCAASTSISMPGFSDFHLISCSDKPMRVLSGPRQNAVLCQKRRAALKASAGRKTRSAFSAVLSLTVHRGRSWRRTDFLYSYSVPKGLYKPPLWPGNWAPLGSFTENLPPCKIFCPRHMVATKCLWVPAAAWASACLAQFVEQVGL